MRSLCIVPCGSRKIWNISPSAGCTQAKQVYIGPFVKKCIEYARKFHPTSWVILSAKYGFLFPSDIISADYNVTFNDRKTNPITFDELSKQIIDKKLTDYDEIIVLGGRNYMNNCIQVFGADKVKTPLASCRGIGFMLSRIKKAIECCQPF
ncbi:MAG: DUF6884 domain-containing protein [Vulcanimicrobiota bacterium]